LVKQAGRLDMMVPDTEKFPCLALAYRAGRMGGTMPAVMNAANEVAVVEYFLKERIKLGEIPRVVKAVMDEHESENVEKPSLEDILKVDGWARKRADSLIRAGL